MSFIHKFFLSYIVIAVGVLVFSCENVILSNGTNEEGEGISLSSSLSESDLPNFLVNAEVPSTETLAEASHATQELFIPYAESQGSKLVEVYVSPTGAGSKDGTSWENAKQGADGENPSDKLKAIIDGISDNGSSVYLVFLSEGVYKVKSSLSMKNNVSLVGGWKAKEKSTNTEIVGTFNHDLVNKDVQTVIDGNGKVQVFYNNKGIDRTASLYGITIANGAAFGPTQGGGAMYNNEASPTLMSVTFFNNKTENFGGAIYNKYSSPLILSSTFFRNSAQRGGAVYNLGNKQSAYVVFNRVTFLENTVDSKFRDKKDAGGGAVYNHYSSAIFIGSVFYNNNESKVDGSSIYSSFASNLQKVRIVNSVFWEDNDTNRDFHLYVNNEEGDYYANIKQYNSVTQDTSVSVKPFSSSENTIVAVAFNKYKNPNLGLMYFNHVPVLVPSSKTNSGVYNSGIYVRSDKAMKQFYFSQDNVNWFDDLVVGNWDNGESVPLNTIELTGKDIRGFSRIGKPDIGAYEF